MSATIDIRELNEMIERQSGFITNLQAGMDQVIVGQKHLVESLLIGLLADGHILLEGLPGLAKTLAIKTLSELIDADFSRIQFTPDLLPADVIGTMIYSQKDEKFQVKKGPVFANFVLADEINRAPAKVQSALLEAMQERQVTIGKETFQLPKPFLVLATQNPTEFVGTYPLPEAQMDRFIMKLSIGYPDKTAEMDILLRNENNVSSKNLSHVITCQEIQELMEEIKKIYCSDAVRDYIVEIVEATRCADFIKLGASPRGSIALYRMAKAYAFVKGRNFVVPDDIKDLAPYVLSHRIILTPKGKSMVSAYCASQKG